MEEAEWITTAEACGISGYHPDYLRVLIRRGKIAAKKWGNTWMVSRSSFQDYFTRMDAQGEKRGPKSSKTDRNKIQKSML